MYWSDVSTRTISRANLDGSGVTTMVNSEISVVGKNVLQIHLLDQAHPTIWPVVQ